MEGEGGDVTHPGVHTNTRQGMARHQSAAILCGRSHKWSHRLIENVYCASCITDKKR